jgi:hypothetical protein
MAEDQHRNEIKISAQFFTRAYLKYNITAQVVAWRSLRFGNWGGPSFF